MTKTLTNSTFRNGAAAALAIVGLSLSAHNAEAFTITKIVDLSLIAPVNSPNGVTNASPSGTTLSGTFSANLPGVAATDFSGNPSNFVFNNATISFGNIPTSDRVAFTSTPTRLPPSPPNGFGNVNTHSLKLTALNVIGGATTPLSSVPKTVTSNPASANPITLTISTSIPTLVEFTPYANFQSMSAIPGVGGVLKADLSDLLRSPANRNYFTKFSGAGKVTVSYNYDIIPEPNMVFGVLGMASLGLLLKKKSSGSNSDRD
jgi:hypothetical protein